MPIYAYRCGTCGHAKDVLQKVSDPVLSTCPACGAETFAKQVTAAGFQLKGSGWYVTDFRGGDSKQGAARDADKAPAADSSTKTDTSTATEKKSADGAAAKPAASSAASPAPATPAPAGTGGSSSPAKS